jgi:hypothetical protein
MIHIGSRNDDGFENVKDFPWYFGFAEFWDHKIREPFHNPDK